MYMKLSQVHCAFYLIFFSIVLQKWIYSCFSKLVQNKSVLEEDLQIVSTSAENPLGILQRWSSVSPITIFPRVKECFLIIPSYDKLSQQATSQLSPKSSNQLLHTVQVPQIHLTTLYWQIKNISHKLLMDSSEGKVFLYLMQKDPLSIEFTRKNKKPWSFKSKHTFKDQFEMWRQILWNSVARKKKGASGSVRQVFYKCTFGISPLWIRCCFFGKSPQKCKNPFPHGAEQGQQLNRSDKSAVSLMWSLMLTPSGPWDISTAHIQPLCCSRVQKAFAQC